MPEPVVHYPSLLTSKLDPLNSFGVESPEEIAASAEEALHKKALANLLSVRRIREKQKEKRAEEGLSRHYYRPSKERDERLAAARKNLETIDKIADMNATELDKLLEDVPIVDDTVYPDTVELPAAPASANVPAQAKRILTKSEVQLLQGTTKPQIARMLAQLGVDLGVSLTKNDTSNLLAHLLTCNEEQLDALYANKKIPVALKTIIKRMLDDAKCGNIDTVMQLWDKLFGKTGLNTPDVVQQGANASGQQSLIPDMPISREAYAILHQTLICKQ